MRTLWCWRCKRDVPMLDEAELQREVIPGHPLYDVDVRAFGRFGRRDDVAFELADGSFAVSHLTWIGRPEQSPKYPWTELYPTAAELQARFDQDEEDYAL